MARLASFILLLAITTTTWGGTVSVPITFQSGTPALASEVNANFQALVDAIDAQQAAIAQLQTDLGAAEAEIDQLQTDLDAAEVTIGQLVNDAGIAAAAIVQLQNDLNVAEADIASNENTIMTIQSNSVLALDGFLFLDIDANGYDTARFDAINVQVTNGLGATNGLPGLDAAFGGPVNGLGNVILGYNETHPVTPEVCESGQFDNQADCEANSWTWGAGQKTGSHNLIVGTGHNYTRHGNLVAGFANTVNARWASVSGGSQNIASGADSSISGGLQNVTRAFQSSVSGGRENRAIASRSSVSGGIRNEASGLNASVSAGRSNVASGESSSASGGQTNIASGRWSSVSGGLSNTASGVNSSVSGGGINTASGSESSVSGGSQNTAGGQRSSVSGGEFRFAPNFVDWAAGSLFEEF